MRIALIGAGYVGLTSGACFAQLGHSVTCVDIDQSRISALKAGRLPIFEPGLEDIVTRKTRQHRLRFGSDIEAGCRDADAIFLAVGTPSRPDGAIDLTFIEAAARQIARPMRRDVVAVIKSTVVPGTARRLREVIAEARGGLDFSVASNPEFLREGNAVADFLSPDRIVVGADDPRAAKVLREIYAPLLAKGAPGLFTNTTNAEMIKYAANAFLALKVGFINEVADLCEQIGGDVMAVAEGIGLDHRIGRAFLSPGPGFGGSCFPKDTRAFAEIGRRHGAPQHLTETLIDRNEDRKNAIAQQVLREIGSDRKAPHVAVLGVAFKANTDDARESAALTIIPQLIEAGCIVHAHDPKARPAVLGAAVIWHETSYEAAAGADIVLILTEWDEYRDLDLKQLARLMAGRTIIDCRNLLDFGQATQHGFRHLAIGRAAPPATQPGHRSRARGARVGDRRAAASPI